MQRQSSTSNAVNFSLVTLLVIAFVGASAKADVTVGQNDDFEDGTTQGWQEALNFPPSPNPPTNVANGGPDGVGDNYLQNISEGFGMGAKMTNLNVQAQWTGNYISAGVKKICADAKVEPTSDSGLSLRAGFQPVAANRYTSLTPAFVPNDGTWYEVVFPVTSSRLVLVGGFGTYNDIMSDVGHFRIYHSTNVSWQGFEIGATLGLDNIRAWGSTGDMDGDCRADVLLRNKNVAQQLTLSL